MIFKQNQYLNICLMHFSTGFYLSSWSPFLLQSLKRNLHCSVKSNIRLLCKSQLTYHTLHGGRQLSYSFIHSMKKTHSYVKIGSLRKPCEIWQKSVFCTFIFFQTFFILSQTDIKIQRNNKKNIKKSRCKKTILSGAHPSRIRITYILFQVFFCFNELE